MRLVRSFPRPPSPTGARRLLAPTLLLIALAACASVSSSAVARGTAHAAVVGGTPAQDGTWPWIAFVESQLDPSRISACTGTVVAANLVLTAAHCVEDTATGLVRAPAAFAVLTGRLEIFEAAAGQVLAVSRVLVYPGFTPALVSGDAALLVLSSPTSAPSVAVATTADAAVLAPGTPAQIAGWGRQAGSSPSLPSRLEDAETVVQRDSWCAAKLGPRFVRATMLCTVDSTGYATSTCQGDSGGPLAARRADGTWVEIGITSWGNASCDPSLPSAFTRVAAVSRWIGAQIAALAPPGSAAPPPPATTPAIGAGIYRGASRQHEAIALRVDARTRLSALTFSYDLRCRRRRGPLAFQITPVTTRHPWEIAVSPGRGLGGFSDFFRDSAGIRYHVIGNFLTASAVTGTLHATWSTRRFGRCDSGVQSYSARLR